MPVHLAPLPRRRFLVLLGASVLAARASDVDEDLVALLNDTHIGGRQALDRPIPANLRATVEFLLTLPKRPAAVIINGDLALRDGQPEDYELFARLIQPLRNAGLPVHLTLGNHDNREVFHRVLASERPARTVVESRHVGVVATRHANFFLLDSLKETMIAPGDLGEGQLHWLARELDARADKPAVVVGHHNPRFGGDPKHFPGGLIDSAALGDLFRSRPHVQAYVHGHIHAWGLARHEGVHIVNTPATSSVANPATSTTGWTMARLRPTGMTLTTHTHLAHHAWNNRVHELGWRS